MTWHYFLWLQSLGAVIIFAAPLRELRGRRLRMLRICAAAFALAFFIDSPFECHGVWTIEGGPHRRLIVVPIENMLVISASVPFAILLHLLAGRFRQWKTAQSQIPGP
jgi:hypothetical protein